MVEKPSERMIQVVGEQPLFKGLSPGQMREVLNLADHRFVEAGKVIYRAHQTVSEVSILFGGNLARIGLNGEAVGAVKPIEPLGFRELLTGRVFKEHLKAIQTCHLATISRVSFEAMMDLDLGLQSILFRNLSNLLAKELEGEAIERLEERQKNEHRFGELRAELDEIGTAVKRILEHLSSEVGSAWSTGPLQEPAQHDEPMGGKTPTPDNPVCVLIVDDEPDLRAFVKRVLSSCIVLEANSGNEALEVIHNTRPDLIIADIRMSGMDGCTLLTNVRNLFPNLPVLATSGFLEVDDLQDYDFDGFIDKPIKPDHLRTVVAEYVQHN